MIGPPKIGKTPSQRNRQFTLTMIMDVSPENISTGFTYVNFTNRVIERVSSPSPL